MQERLKKATMLTTKLTIFLLLLYTCEVFGRECNDCIFIRLCSNAVAETKRDKDVRAKFSRAHCGFGYNEKGKKLPKICCNDFNPMILNTRTNFETDEDIENHKNIQLLPRDCGPINGDRIVGGEFAKLFEYPWMALIASRIGNTKRFYCGGTIINSKYILTAAHCVKSRPYQIAGVRVGEHDKNSALDCEGEPPERVCEKHLQNIKVDKVIIHPEYSKVPSTINDIALIRLKKHINFTYRNVKPICLPVANLLRNVSLEDKTATVAGWGVTETGSQSNILRKVDIPILPDDDCRVYNGNASGSSTTSTLLCAGEDGKDSCQGDSGGPLMLEMEYEDIYRIYQYGIVSKGARDCGSGDPGVYTDVSKYIKWILDNIEA